MPSADANARFMATIARFPGLYGYLSLKSLSAIMGPKPSITSNRNACGFPTFNVSFSKYDFHSVSIGEEYKPVCAYCKLKITNVRAFYVDRLKVRIADNMDDLGGRIRIKRKKLGLTQDDFADLAGMPLRTFQNYESGKRSIPSKLLPQIAEALGCSVADLYTDLNLEPNPEDVLRRILHLLTAMNKNELLGALMAIEALTSASNRTRKSNGKQGKG